MTTTSVAITRCTTYDQTELDTALELICKEAGIPDPRGKTILLKPNILSDALPEKAITTRAEVVAAVIRYLKIRKAHLIYVGDSPGIHGPDFRPRACGIEASCISEGAIWIDFSKQTRKRAISGAHRRTLPFPCILDEVDMVVSLSKMKTHQLMYLTGSVKNLFGVIPGLSKSASHLHYPTRESFARLMAGIYKEVCPSFGIVDAIIGMEGPGPANGKPRYVGLLMASQDCSALDVAQSMIMGYDPLEIPLTRELHARNMTHWKSISDISYPLLHAANLVQQDWNRIPIQKRSSLFGSMIGPALLRRLRIVYPGKDPRPLFSKATCIGCGRCIAICPGKALTLDSKHAIIADYSLCIRCYCCHEICPVNAISIEQKE